MAWARFDDHFDDDPDCDIVGEVGICLFVCSITWASRNLTNGFIPEARVRKLAGGDASTVALLTSAAVRWWVPVDGGYQIRNYLRYNPSRDDVMAERQRAADRKQGSRDRRRSADAVTSPVTDAVTSPVTDAVTSPVTDAVRPGAPVSRIPYPDSQNPVHPHPDSESDAGAAPPGNAVQERVSVKPDDGFDAFWAAYPITEAKDAARKAWRSLAPDPELQERVLAGIERAKLSDRWQRGMIPFAGKWLTDRRWEDEFAPPLALAVSDPQSRARNGPCPARTNFNRPRTAAEAAPPLGVSALATEAARIQARFDALQIKGQNCH
jgi:hypothetical protein